MIQGPPPQKDFYRKVPPVSKNLIKFNQKIMAKDFLAQTQRTNLSNFAENLHRAKLIGT